ncbi:MAG: SpvB/TcaC N-terminal domain-containing protein [Ferruginibacter sp.]
MNSPLINKSGQDASVTPGNKESFAKENPTKSNAIEIPSISLPNGGGALKGIDEKFEVNAANGTASYSIPLPVSPGRNGFTPALSLSYNSGSGNSAFGLGWDIGLSAIQRKTDKKIPRYREDPEEDIFMFSSVEDLVPFLIEVRKGERESREVDTGGYSVKRYRPRIEGSFSKIERITHKDHGVYWKVTTRENVATFFGRSKDCRIADPEDGNRIFKWLPEFSFDDKGNWMVYGYKEDSNILPDDRVSIPGDLHEQNRKNGNALFTNRYLKRVSYGNRFPYYLESEKTFDPKDPIDSEHFFEVVFDYGDHDASIPTTADKKGFGLETYRPDAFSNYHAGFEIRTARLCRRVLMFHHFKEEKQQDGSDFGNDYLVRSLDFDYIPSSINNSGIAEVTYLKRITQCGYIRKAPGEVYSKKSLPPVEFEYQQLIWNKEIKDVGEDSIVNAPAGLTNNYQWVDFYGEGMSGIFTEQDEGWYYKSNLGVDENGELQLAPAKIIAPKPSFTGLNSGTLQLMDLDANGEKQVGINAPDIKGFFQLTDENDWEPFHSFLQVANIDLHDPYVRTIDLSGDGMPDLVVTEENVFVWYASEGKKGYASASFAAKTLDEEKGPAIVFADSLQTIFLADMSGDGMTDIVRIRNGETCYWPNMGYGKFGAKVNMSNAPVFDGPDQFNPGYLHLADVSGTGATDIIYTGKNKCTAYLNLGGNQWNDGYEIETLPEIQNKSQLAVIDLLGTGTSCIVWSSDLPGDTEAPMRYIDLMSSKKPHVMVKHINNMGLETTVEYKSSTWFYLQDKKEGKPWITKLPFPVQVVASTTVEEKITNVKFTTQYSYHHGYYDHTEKEFRGFGRVEQLDTEQYKEWILNKADTKLDDSVPLFQKPVLTKTWFHTGAFLDKEKILTQFETEYWYNEMERQGFVVAVNEPALPDAQVKKASTINDENIIDNLSADEWREAFRACKGMTLRQEVFALDAPLIDGTDDERRLQLTPYSVATHNCNIQLLQPRGNNPFAVFISTESESIQFHYERNIADPRIAHSLNVVIDDLGNVQQMASVVYGRNPGKAKAAFDLLRNTVSDFDNDKQVQDAFIRNCDFGEKAQQKTHITYTRNSFTTDFIPVDDSVYLLRMAAGTETFELTGFVPAKDIFLMNDFVNVLDDVAMPQPVTGLITYLESPDPDKKQRRLIEHVQTLYYDEDLLKPLPLSQLNMHGLVYQNYQLAFTPAMLNQVLENKLAAMPAGAGYVNNNDANWWIPSGIVHYRNIPENFKAVQDRFFTPLFYTDAFGFDTNVSFYENLLLKTVEDAMHNKTTVEAHNFRTLSPSLLRDINDNLSQIVSDELGLPKAMALLGKDLNGDGKADLEIADNIDGIPEITEAENNDIALFFNLEDSNQLIQGARKLLQNATARFVYDFDSYRTNTKLSQPVKPIAVAGIIRETHNDANSKIQMSFEYTDGMGKQAMKKVQANQGIAKKAVVQPGDGFNITIIDTSAPGSALLRWIGNGRTVLNNKGNPVKQYEPYFSVTPFYEDIKELVESGVTPVLYYDSVGRNIKTVFPDETFTTVEFDSWKQLNYDQDDNILKSGWYSKRISNPFDPGLIAAGKDSAKEKDAATKAFKHNNTPSQVHMDALGRPIISIEDNDKDNKNNDRFYTTCINLDIEGNARKFTDARGNEVMNYLYDMLGHRVYQNSMDAGERWMLNNAVHNPVLKWDGRNQVFSFTYDALHRPLEMKITGGEDAAHQLDNVYEKINYGEDKEGDKTNNLRGKPCEHFDTAGKLSFIQYDLKGNLLESKRQLIGEKYKEVPNWSGGNISVVDDKKYASLQKYDALNRVMETTAPDKSITSFTYNESNLLDKVSVMQNGVAMQFVKSIDYNEKGQRKAILYGNNVSTGYEYDKDTFRLTHLNTRTGAGKKLQDIYYTYDPVGNITQQEDKCIPQQFFNNYFIDGISRYEYDALYRLMNAEGREHAGQLVFDKHDNSDDFSLMMNPRPHPNDLMTWQTYKQDYLYDPVGNIKQVSHRANGKGWIRDYDYEANNNRLNSTTIAGNAAIYEYPHHPKHGFITGMPHLQKMEWNFKDELQSTATQQVNADNPPTTYYVYDAQGQRVRKVTENSAGNKINERIYLGSAEFYFEYDGATTLLSRDTLHVMDDSQRIAMIETLNLENGKKVSEVLIRYQFSNHLGSACLELNEEDEPKIISYEEYHPYGTTSYQAMNADIKSAAKRYRYTGLERDEETGFGYHSARYYVSWLGRWTATDPMGIEAGGNLYSYASDNPILKLDKDGMEPLTYGKEGKNSLKVKIWGRAFIDEPLKDTRGESIGHQKLGEFNIKWDPIKQKVEVNVGALDVEAGAKAGSVFIFASAKVAKASLTLRQGEEFKAGVTLYEAGVGVKVGPVKGKVLFGLSAGIELNKTTGKIGVKVVPGIGGEIEIDAAKVASYLAPPVKPLFLISTDPKDEPRVRYSYVPQVKRNPPHPKQHHRGHIGNRHHQTKHSEAFQYLGYPLKSSG